MMRETSFAHHAIANTMDMTKVITDKAFDKAWKIKTCPCCKDKKILFFKDSCDECFQLAYAEFLKQFKAQTK